jgi:hypothetical protein
MAGSDRALLYFSHQFQAWHSLGLFNFGRVMAHMHHGPMIDHTRLSEDEPLEAMNNARYS